MPIGSNKDTAVDLREKFEEWGIDIDSVANGVYLPNGHGIDNPEGRTFHNETLRNSYFAYLERKFVSVETAGEALEVLEQIKEELMEGTPDLPRRTRSRANTDRVERFIDSRFEFRKEKFLSSEVGSRASMNAI